jgi:hypothetical protein
MFFITPSSHYHRANRRYNEVGKLIPKVTIPIADILQFNEKGIKIRIIRTSGTANATTDSTKVVQSNSRRLTTNFSSRASPVYGYIRSIQKKESRLFQQAVGRS